METITLWKQTINSVVVSAFKENFRVRVFIIQLQPCTGI